jgi:hypothetical protein
MSSAMFAYLFKFVFVMANIDYMLDWIEKQLGD